MKIRMRYLIIIAVGLLIATNSNASETVAGAGVNSCGKFLADIETGGEVLSAVYFSWAQGYLTGLNTKYSLGRRSAAELPDRAEIEFWIRIYCEDNPLDQYLMAATRLWASLRATQGLDPI